MVEYRIKVKDASGALLGEFETFRNLKFGKRLNDYGVGSFDIPVTDAKLNSLVSLRKFTVEIFRRDTSIADSVFARKWAGEMFNRVGDLDTEKNNWATIEAQTWLALLNDRYTVAERTFDNVDAGEIVMTMIDETQAETNGNFGITEGEVVASADRIVTFNNQNLMEAIINLSNMRDGFDFEITDDKVINIKPVIGVDRSDSITLEYGRNVSRVRITENFTHPANRAIVLGEEYGAEELSRVEVDDSALQAEYKLREQVFSETLINGAETLADRGDAMIRKYGRPLFKLDLNITPGKNPSIDDFALGDSVLVKVNSGLYNIEESYRIYEWSVELDSNNVEKLSLILSNFATEYA